MKMPENIKVWGNLDYRDPQCPRESVEQITFVSRIANRHPQTYGRIIVHPKNEQQLIGRQFSKITLDKSMGSINKGASDILIPGNPAFVCEIKRRDHTLSVLAVEQIEYLEACIRAGAYACVALGCDAAIEAFEDWRKLNGSC